MRIAFDFDAVAVERFSGFHQYGMSLIRELAESPENIDAVLFCSPRFSAQARELVNSCPDRISYRPALIKIRWLENIWKFSRLPELQNLTGDFDIYHCIHHLMPPTAHRPRIMTVHDLRRYKLPELYKNSKLWRFELAVKRADHFIAVSQSTKDDLCNVFSVPPQKVDVVHLAADPNLSPLTDVEKQQLKLKLSEQTKTSLDRFVITISSPDARKNIERTIRAFKAVAQKLPRATKLVVAGTLPRNLDKDLLEKYPDRAIPTGPIENLYDWLRCADALVFASLYEGFGIPILEAFASGVPVITSNCSSMPEVAAGAALLVDPCSEQAIGQAIVSICNDWQKTAEMIEAGLERNRQFNWRKTAAKTLDVYRKLLR
jgi:glycosyltransferase involved in cell wall biosynthesis